MVEQNDLFKKLKQCDAFLTRCIEIERKISRGESLMSPIAIAGDQRVEVYRSIQEELYKWKNLNYFYISNLYTRLEKFE